MSSNKLEYAEHESLEACASYLRQILDGMDSRKLSMSRGRDSLQLHPEGPVRFRLKVTQSEGEEALKFELKWSRAAFGIEPTGESLAPEAADVLPPSRPVAVPAVIDA